LKVLLLVAAQAALICTANNRIRAETRKIFSGLVLHANFSFCFLYSSGFFFSGSSVLQLFFFFRISVSSFPLRWRSCFWLRLRLR